MHNFSNIKNHAIYELREMSKRATQTKCFSEENEKILKQIPRKNRGENFGIAISNDEIIILGLILILSKDCGDYWLLLALLYILM